MRWDPAEFERTPSRFQRALGIAGATLAVVGTGAMTLMLVLPPITIGSVIASSIFVVLFGVSCWLWYRFAFTDSVALSARTARRLFALSVACAFLNLAIKLIAHLLR